jgi:hypothetical protein
MSVVDPPFYGQLSDPPTRHFAVTPSNSTNLTVRPRALYVGTQGNLTLIDEHGTSCAYVGVTGLLPFRPVRVMATGTTATNIVAIY